MCTLCYFEGVIQWAGSFPWEILPEGGYFLFCRGPEAEKLMLHPVLWEDLFLIPTSHKALFWACYWALIVIRIGIQVPTLVLCSSSTGMELSENREKWTQSPTPYQEAVCRWYPLGEAKPVSSLECRWVYQSHCRAGPMSRNYWPTQKWTLSFVNFLFCFGIIFVFDLCFYDLF